MYILIDQRKHSIVCIPLSLLHSVAIRSYNIRVSNYQSQLPITNNICLAIAKLSITFDYLIASGNFRLYKITLSLSLSLSVSLSLSLLRKRILIESLCWWETSYRLVAFYNVTNDFLVTHSLLLFDKII